MMMKKILFVLLSVITAAVLSAAEVKIDLNNVVIVRRNARQKNLANDLRAHLELMGSCKIKVVAWKKRLTVGTFCLTMITPDRFC